MDWPPWRGRGENAFRENSRKCPPSRLTYPKLLLHCSKWASPIRILTSSSNHPIISTDMVADLLALLSPRQVEELEQAVSALFDHGSNKACLEDGEEVDGGRTAE